MHLLGQGTGGVWRRPEALLVVSEGGIRAQLHDGHWQSPFPGVYADGGYELTPVGWGYACLLASGGGRLRDLPPGAPPSELGAVLCGRDAARLSGVPLVDDDDPATAALDRLQHDVCVWTKLDPLVTRRRLEGQEVHRLVRHQLRLDRSDVERHASGLWTTTTVRTLFDLSLLVTHEALVCAIDAALHRGDVTREELEAYADQHLGWRGRRRFQRAVELSDGRAESPHESLTRLLLKPAWPALEPQVRLRNAAGRVVARFDHADAEIGLAVESDGKLAHNGQVSRERDTRRDRTAESYGYVTERVSWFQVRRQGPATRSRVLAVRDARRARRAA